MELAAIYQRFPTRAACLHHLESIRWKGQPPRCPYCGSSRSTSYPRVNRHHCNNCNTSYSVTVGTLFHKTRADLQKWFGAVVLLVHEHRGVSSRQLAAAVDVNRNTAVLMRQRIRRAMMTDRDLLLDLGGNV
jgi:transposase-like protein